ncbi:MAG: chemotaxis protein CheA [Pseudomonadota bacterium]
MTNDEIQNIFLLECDEGLSVAETGLMAMQSGEGDTETTNSIFRAVHSIKGGAGAFGFTELQAFTHKFETVLQQVRDGDRAADDKLLAIMMRAFDTLADHVTAVKGEAPTPNDKVISDELEAVANILEASDEGVESGGGKVTTSIEPTSPRDDFDFDSLLAELDSPGETALPDWKVFVQPTAKALANGGEPLLLLRELVALGGKVIELYISATPDLDQFDATDAILAWTLQVPASTDRAAIEEIFDFSGDACTVRIETMLTTDIKEQLLKTVAETSAVAPVSALPPVAIKAAQKALRTPVVAELPPPPPPFQSTPVAPGSQTIRVELDKLDRLVDSVGELVITQSMLAQRLAGAGVVTEDEMSQFEYLTRELQDCAMALRAQPIRSVFSRVPRIVRELEAQTGKRVKLDVFGEATELDKTVIERIGEPLTHLIRNAIDHGLETTEERIAAGKPPEGVVRLSAEHRGGRILITVSDDGRGINRERVLAKAIERGIVAADTRISNEEIDNLVFAAGFSTAQEVSSISGRGVGMDVVKQNIHALGGRVSINSRPGEGATFSLTLPLTLAIADGMIVRVGSETLILPLTHIVESLKPERSDIVQMSPGCYMLNVRGNFLPVMQVAKALNIKGERMGAADSVMIVVETEAMGQTVLMVDTICDQRQVVIKSIETNYKSVPGVAGATILGDGRIALIVDVEALSKGDVGSVVALSEAA